MIRSRIFVIAFLGALAPCACLGLEDAAYRERAVPARDAGHPLSDAGGDGGDGGIPMSPCNHCIFDDGAPCRPDYDTCAKNEKCGDLVVCAAELRCLELKDLTLILPCAQVCLDRAGVTSSTDPSTQAAAPLFYCTKDAARCGNVCSN